MKKLTVEEANSYTVHSLSYFSTKPHVFMATLIATDLPTLIIRLEYKKSVYHRTYVETRIIDKPEDISINFSSEYALSKKVEKIIDEFKVATHYSEEKCTHFFQNN